eukprot:COSAG01_NODE_41087_length_456_cov_0.571429_1_plen_112_part_10
MYCDAAYIGCWAQAWKVTQRKMGDTVVCVLPALAAVLEEATMLRSAQEFQWTAQLGLVSDMSKALLDAWLACVCASCRDWRRRTMLHDQRVPPALAHRHHMRCLAERLTIKT